MSGNRLLIVGTVALDSLETPYGRRDQVFGGSASYAAYAASFFCPSQVVSVVGEDFPEAYQALLLARSINLDYLEVRRGRTFRWKGRYGYDLNVAETLETEINVLAGLHPRLNDNADPTHVFLANVDPGVQLELLQQLKRPRLKCVAADTMNYWIQAAREKLYTVLGKIDLLILNDGEARLLAKESNLLRAGRRLQNLGPQAVVIKKGEHGVLLLDGQKFFALPGYPLEDVFDPTGAGDTFGGALVGYLAREGRMDFETLKQAVLYGSVVASFTVERFGLERLTTLTWTDIEARRSRFKTFSTPL